MIRDQEDLFVGIAAIALGLFLIAGAATNWKWYYSLRTGRWLQRLLGRRGTRLFNLLLGLGLIALGTAIGLGYRWTLIGS